MVYLFLLVTGVLGYLAMMLLGFSHGFGHHGDSGGGLGDSHAHGPSLGHGHGHAPVDAGHHAPVAHRSPGTQPAATSHLHAHHGHAPGEPHPNNWGLSVLALFSPLNLFSMMIGAGLTGVALGKLLSPEGLIVAAILGALLFSMGFVQPLMKFFMRFASEPAKGLEGSMGQSAVAEAAFDERGRGVVTVAIDGELTRLLARLPENELAQTVKKGDEVVILEVDAKKGSCVVTTQFRSLP